MAFFWISTKAPMLRPVTDRAPIEIHEIGMADDNAISELYVHADCHKCIAFATKSYLQPATKSYLQTGWPDFPRVPGSHQRF